MHHKTTWTRRATALALAAFAACATGSALAQTRTIRIVVPFGPGAVQDTIARAINAELGQALGATVIVENRAGAGGSIGTAVVAKAEPDGNTLVLAAASHTLAGHLYAKLPYDPIKDFTAVGYMGTSGYAIVAPGNLGVNNLAEYVKLIQSKPGALNYATAGNGSATHMGMAYFLSKFGGTMQHIPMKSTGDAVNEVLAGRAQGVTTALIGIAGYKNDARLKPLAYTGTKRSKFMPDLPTVAEAGVPGYKFDSWIGLLGPANMPKAEVDRINNALIKVMAEPAVQERFTRLGVETSTLPAEDFQKLLRADWDQAGVIVKASGARIE